MEEAMKLLIGEVFSGMEDQFRSIVREEVKAALAKSATLNNTKPILSTDEACAYLSLCENSLKNVIIEHGIQKYKLGAKNYYKTEDLNRIFGM